MMTITADFGQNSIRFFHLVNFEILFGENLTLQNVACTCISTLKNDLIH